MALIKCPECGKEISDRAKACIHCGFPLDEYHSKGIGQDVVQRSVLNAVPPDIPFLAEGKEAYKNKQYEQAYQFFLRAAESGNAEAQYYIGLLYQNGYFVAKSDSSAFEWYLKSAEQNFSPSLNNIGMMYLQGIGVAKDTDKATYYLHQASTYGSGVASANLGLMYERGMNVVQNYARAVELYNLAISQGDKQAGVYERLGILYANGNGTSVNYTKAEQLLSEAIRLGSKNAKSNYDAVLKLKKQAERRQVEEQKAQEKEEWRRRLTRTCPRCGRHSGHPIDEFEKKLSISFWGYASNKWGKSYKCDACDYMW